MSDKNIVCHICGGTDFYNEGGFYYCNECQTQTQEIREQVFDVQDNTINIRTTTTTVRKKRGDKRSKLTSWEIYNYIMLGLVDELVELGANKEFKEVACHLWMEYLTKLEILSNTQNGIPKLSAVYRKRDAEIVYNIRKAKRRKVGTSVSGVSIDTDPKSIYKERSKQRKKVIQAEYDQFSSTQQSFETSIHNQTLTSLSVDDNSSVNSDVQNIYSSSAKKELLKHMSRAHLQKHIKDVDGELTCHKLAHLLSNSYRRGPLLLTKNKLYCVIYLALLLTQDQFQISDLIRFCREGHLSYLEYKHFFPDPGIADEGVYLKGKKDLFLYDYMRKRSHDIYKLLKLKPCDFSPDLIQLCERYCKELNLPDHIFNMAGDLINRSKPKFQNCENNSKIPNYEGRTMAFIIYILKFLFSFDDITEYKLTDFSQLINQKSDNLDKNKAFVWSDWFNYIEYRKIVLKNTHFPTSFQLEPDKIDNIDLFVQFLQQKRIANDHNEPETLKMTIAKKLLGDLEILQESFVPKNLEFQHSLTPFRSYIDNLLIHFDSVEIFNQKLNRDFLQDLSQSSVEFLINPHPFLKLIDSEKCEIKYTNAHTNQKLFKIRQANETIRSFQSIYEKRWDKVFLDQQTEQISMQLILDKILNKHLQNTKHEIPSKPKEIPKKNKKRKNNLKETVPESSNQILYLQDKYTLGIKNSIGRNSSGRFCSLSSKEVKTPDYFKQRNKKWRVTSWYENPNPVQHTYNPSLFYQITEDEISKEERKKNKKPQKQNKCKYSTHFLPHLEYWVNVRDVAYMSQEQWKEFEENLPRNFRWLLEECARIIEQSPKELFLEFINVEIYLNYVQFGHCPILSKPYCNYKEITKLIKKVKSIW